MASYKDLVKQREALDQAIAQARQAELAQAISQVKGLVAEFGLTAEDIFGGGRSRAGKSRGPKAGGKVAPKYRNPATGETWTGRGKAPRWIDGKDRAAFLIA